MPKFNLPPTTVFRPVCPHIWHYFFIHLVDSITLGDRKCLKVSSSKMRRILGSNHTFWPLNAETFSLFLPILRLLVVYSYIIIFLKKNTSYCLIFVKQVCLTCCFSPILYAESLSLLSILPNLWHGCLLILYTKNVLNRLWLIFPLGEGVFITHGWPVFRCNSPLAILRK